MEFNKLNYYKHSNWVGPGVYIGHEEDVAKCSCCADWVTVLTPIEKFITNLENVVDKLKTLKLELL